MKPSYAFANMFSISQIDFPYLVILPSRTVCNTIKVHVVKHSNRLIDYFIFIGFLEDSCISEEHWVLEQL